MGPLARINSIFTIFAIFTIFFSLNQSYAEGLHFNSLNKTGKKIYEATQENNITKISQIINNKHYDAKTRARKLNYRDKEGRTPLIIASMNGYQDIARLLIQLGANPAWKDSSGLRAEDYAYESNDTEMKALVRIKGQGEGDEEDEIADLQRPKIKIYNDGSFSWRKCINKKDFGGNTIPFVKIKKRFVFLPECAPDILYSWKDADKYDKKMQDPNVFFELNKDKGLYTWRTPMGSYAYGTLPLRIKLRANIHFVLLDNSMEKRKCKDFPEGEKENTVYVSYIRELNMSEYLLCSEGPVESWSAGIPELITEIKKERSTVEKLYGKSKTPQALHHYDVDTMLKFKSGVNVRLFSVFPGNFWGLYLDEGTNWSVEALDKRIADLEHYQQARKNFIKYASDIPQDRNRHLRSKYFSYFTAYQNEAL